MFTNLYNYYTSSSKISDENNNENITNSDQTSLLLSNNDATTTATTNTNTNTNTNNTNNNIMSSEGLISQQEQDDENPTTTTTGQSQGPYHHNNNNTTHHLSPSSISSNPNLDIHENCNGQDCFWHFTDFGHARPLSRDGSIHSTDEVFNSVSHLSAFFMSVLASVLLITEASAMGAPWKIVSFSIYGASLCFLFAASTLHHAISTTPQWERRFQLLDYLAIFPLIAGSFTPLCLVYFHDDPIGWVFGSVVWTLSIASMYVTAAYFTKIPKWLTMTFYITLGWLGAFMTFWLWPIMGTGGITLLVLGGVLYTIGGYIYTTEQPNPVPGRFGFHELWHIFVILAAATHWFMMYSFVLPYQKPSE